MPPKDEPSAASQLTDNELRFIASALRHAKGGSLQVRLPLLNSRITPNLLTQQHFDTDAVGAEMRLKDGGVARARWNTISRKGLSKPVSESKKVPPKKTAPAAPKGKKEAPKIETSSGQIMEDDEKGKAEAEPEGSGRAKDEPED